MIRKEILFNLICRTAVNYRFFRIKPPHDRLEVIWNGQIVRGSDVLAVHADEYGEKLFDRTAIYQISFLDVACKLGFAPLGNDDITERTELLRALYSVEDEDLEYFARESVDIDEFSKWIKKFRAFDDPHGKKIHLMVKILSQNGFWTDVIGDKQIPLDYHTIGMVVRLGKISSNRYFEDRELMPENAWVAMRNDAFRYYRKLIEDTGQDPYEFDDMIWQRSRNFCSDMKCSRCSWNCECEQIEGQMLANTVWF